MARDWQPDLRSLRYFVCVAEEKSITRASARLSIAQPALSRQIQRLESELGVSLMHRSSRGIELTTAGAMLLERAYTILNQIQQTHHDLADPGGGAQGVVTVGMPPTPGELIAPMLLAKLRSEYPKIELRFREGFSNVLERQLANNEIGVAVMHDPEPRDEFAIYPLLVEQLWVIGKRGTLNANGYAFSEAARLPLILPGRSNYLRVLIDSYAGRHGIELNEVQRSDGVWLLKALVRFGHGYSILTFGGVTTEVEQATLEAVPIRDPRIDWTLCLATRKDQLQRKAVAIVVAEIRSIAEGLIQQGVWR